MNLKYKIRKLLNKFLSGKSSLKDLIWLYLTISRKNKIRLSKLFFLIIFSAIIEVLSISLVAPFLGLLIDSDSINKYPLINNFSSFFYFKDPLLLASFFLIFTNILSPFVRLYNLKKGGEITADIGSEFSYKVFSKNLYQPYIEYLNENSSSLISAANVDIGRVVIVLTAINSMTTGLFSLLFIISNLFFINFNIAIICILIFTFCYLFIGILTRKRLLRNSQIVSEGSKKQVQLIQDIFGSLREIILYKSQNLYLRNYLEIDKPIRSLGAENIFLSSFPKYILESVGIISIISISIIFYLSEQNKNYIFPLLGVIAISAQRILPAFQQMYVGWATVKGNGAHLKRVKKLISKESLDIEAENLNSKYFLKKIIKFKNVNFKYSKKDKFIFKDLNLTIKKGEKIGLVGPTGQGKSTFINILMGFLYPLSGKIMIDDFVIDGYQNIKNLKIWQSCIAYVPQNIYLKDSSFIDNIAFDLNYKKLNLEKIYEVSRIAKIKNFIEKTNKGFYTNVGERGVLLSGGQIQRIAIARALYREKSILILDEATSALDISTETEIINSISSKKDLTLIMIAHRLNTLKDCDRIFNFLDNKIEEINYEELISKTKYMKQD